MPQSFTQSHFETLADHEHPHSVSIYIKTTTAGAETLQNAVHFRNGIAEAQEQLKAAGVSDELNDELLRPLHELADNDDFWQRQTGGLAVFRSPEYYAPHKLDDVPENLTAVGKHFHLRPLIPVLSKFRRFYILALSLNRVVLYRATRTGISVVDDEALKLPASMDDALGLDDPEQSLQAHTAEVRGGGTQVAMHHGHGGGKDDEHINQERFFQLVDQALTGWINKRGEALPLVLATVGEHAGRYRAQADYPDIEEGVIEGNPDHENPDTLREKGWEIIAPREAAHRQELIESVSEAVGQGENSATDLPTAVAAAIHGRVDTAVVARTGHIWGRFKPETATIETDKTPGANSEDLLDRVAVQTIRNGGRAVIVDRGEAPGDGDLAVRLRY
jgi:hypothetical protein